MNREYNQYGDLIFSPEEQKLLQQFKRSYEEGWELETNDPQDEVQTEDFINKYIVHFKKKREWNNQQIRNKIIQESEQRNKNFLQKLFEKNKYKK